MNVASFPLEQAVRVPIKGRRGKTAVEGAYCPIPPADLLARRLASGKYRMTALGLEAHCCACDDYWPADTEFFYPIPSKRTGLHEYCKACYLERSGRLAGIARS